MDETLTLTELFKFTSWKDNGNYSNSLTGWHEFKVSQWVRIGDDLDLWRKYKEENPS
jgi:hypothetical protein